MTSVGSQGAFYTLGDPMVRSAFCGRIGVDDLDDIREAQRGGHLQETPTIFQSGGSILRDFIWANLVLQSCQNE